MSKIKFLTNKPFSKLPKNVNGLPITLCDDDSKFLNLNAIREERDVDIKEIKHYFDEMEYQRKNSPDSKFKEKLLLSANFLAQDILRIVSQNVGNLTFLRLYVGINEDGDHILCIAPIGNDKKLIVSEGTIYASQCCGYPPHTANFVGDPILGIIENQNQPK